MDRDGRGDRGTGLGAGPGQGDLLGGGVVPLRDLGQGRVVEVGAAAAEGEERDEGDAGLGACAQEVRSSWLACGSCSGRRRRGRSTAPRRGDRGRRG